MNKLAINNGLIDQDIEEKFNFKPIYAATSYTQGLDLTTIQNFEQSFFNDYALLKEAYKKYKHRMRLSFTLLKELDVQAVAFELLKRSQVKTIDYFNLNKSTFKKKLKDQLDINSVILKQYTESINELKRYEIHPGLRKEGKKFLMDYYYDENSMHKWRDSCLRNQENVKSKAEKFEKDFQQVKAKYGNDSSSGSAYSDDPKSKELYRRLEIQQSEKEPLIISIISTVYENLKEMHNHLKVFSAIDPKANEIKQAQQFLMDIEKLKQKQTGHDDLARGMEQHYKELEVLIEEIKAQQFRVALQIINICQLQCSFRKELKTLSITHEIFKHLNDQVVRLEKDFTYLQHPQNLPRAYEKAMIEVQRRRKFRKIVDNDVSRLKKLIHKENKERTVFINEFGRILPNNFIPQLREAALQLKIEGGQQDYLLPEIEDAQIDDYEEFIVSAGAQANNDNKEFKALQKEQTLLKEEHKQNIKELNNKLQEMEVNIQVKTEKIKELTKSLVAKEEDTKKNKQEIERLMRTLKDTSQNIQNQLQENEKTIMSKQKMIETLMKEKKCKNCILCLEDLKDKSPDMVITDLNDRLMTKTKRIDQLEDQLRKSTTLINQITAQTFMFLRVKTQDFFKSIDQTKQSYENKLMEVEEKLSLEQKRCETVIKTRVATLEDKYMKAVQKEGEFKKRVKELLLQKESTDKEVKVYSQKQNQLLQEIAKLNTDASKFSQERKNLEDQVKKLQYQLSEEKERSINEKRRAEDALKAQISQAEKDAKVQASQIEKEAKDQKNKLTKALEQVQEEKIKIEEKTKRDNALLIKQLNELKEQSEKDLREKNETILRLNSVINEHFDKSQESNVDFKQLKDTLVQKDKEIALKSKDLQDITLVLSKRDKEIQQLKNQIEKINQDSLSVLQKIKLLERELEDSKRENKVQRTQSTKELERLKEQMRQTELKSSKENDNNVLQRIKELACTTLNIQADQTWETSLTRALTACTFESINFMRASEGQRILFMPHSPGVYIALVLKNVEDIEQDQVLRSKDFNYSDQFSQSKSETSKAVQKLTIKNNLFLDIESLSKNLQTILKQYTFIDYYSSFQMIVIARIKGITKHQATVDSNPFQLDLKDNYFLCQIEKLEHFVGFEGDDLSFTDYACK